MTDSRADRLYALCSDTRTAARVEADLTGMLERRGLSPAAVRADRLEWLAAQTRCAACDEVDRCHHYLDGGNDEPDEFCANSGELAALRGGN
jgi:hypothetical protein